MEDVTPGAAVLRPAPFCRYLLKTLEAAEGQTRRRKRDQGPDKIGLGIRRALLERATADDPEPEAFERWLMAQVFSAPASGPVRAMGLQVLEEYRLARLQPAFTAWLTAGAPSDDATSPPRVKTDEEIGGSYVAACPYCSLDDHLAAEREHGQQAHAHRRS